jgi:hypothetical protein
MTLPAESNIFVITTAARISDPTHIYLAWIFVRSTNYETVAILVLHSL